MIYEVIKTRGTRVSATAHIYPLHSHQHLSSSELIVVTFYCSESPSNVNNQHIIQWTSTLYQDRINVQ